MSNLEDKDNNFECTKCDDDGSHVKEKVLVEETRTECWCV